MNNLDDKFIVCKSYFLKEKGGGGEEEEEGHIRRGRRDRGKEEERNGRTVKTDHMLIPEPKYATLIESRRYNSW